VGTSGDRRGEGGGAPAAVGERRGRVTEEVGLSRRAATSLNRGSAHHRPSTSAFPPIESISADGRVRRPSRTGDHLAAAGKHADRRKMPPTNSERRKMPLEKVDVHLALQPATRSSSMSLPPTTSSAVDARSGHHGPQLRLAREGNACRDEDEGGGGAWWSPRSSSSVAVFRAAGERPDLSAARRSRGALTEDGSCAHAMYSLCAMQMKEMHPHFAYPCWSHTFGC
jgi:hypothetical protein